MSSIDTFPQPFRSKHLTSDCSRDIPRALALGPAVNIFISEPAVREKMERFLRHERDTIRKKYPNQLLTCGFASLDTWIAYAHLADHVYGEGDRIRSTTEKAEVFAARENKPILITEALANFKFPPYDVADIARDSGQLEHYRKVLPALHESKIGWMAWGLVGGRTVDSCTNIF